MNLNSEISRRTRAQVLIFLTSYLLVWFFIAQPWALRLEYAIFDDRLTELRANTVISDQVKVIMIDESSLSYMAPSIGSFPWPRAVYGELIEFFQMGGAKAVIFDILFTEPEQGRSNDSNAYSDQDLALAKMTENFSGTVHAMLLNKDIEDEGATTLNRKMPSQVVADFSLPITAKGIQGAQNTFTLPINIITESSPYLGVVGLDPDNDGVYRRVKPLWVYDDKVYPALSITPLIIDAPLVEFDLLDRQLTIGSATIPLDDKGRMLVNFYGDMQPISIAKVFQSFKQISSGDAENLPLDPFEFENSVVFVGASAIGLDDTKSITNDAKAPGVYVHAAAYSNIIQHELLTPMRTPQTLIAVAVLTLIDIVMAFNIPWFWLKLVFLIGTPVAWWWLCGLFLQNNIQLNFTQPTTGFALGWSWSFTYLSVTEGASKRRVKRMLSQYVSPAMLDQVMAQRDDILHAGVGKSETLSILFSDVRGFTKISESLPAEQVVTLLNCHFSEMADAIFNNMGTLDKFIGDAIMAYWGAPIRLDDHADRSVKASLDMIQALRKVNRQLSDLRLPSIEIGIGINTGDVVLGNIGSDRKLDYTVIGDAVNVASRMEGITKMYGVPIIISETTRMALRTNRPCVLIDHVQVKGKTEPVAIYLPLADELEAPEQFAEHCRMATLAQRAFAYYQTQQWDIAETLYRQLELPHVRALFFSRILEFRRNPPPVFWDGVYTFTTK